MTYSNYVMDLRELFESPIGQWTIDPDMERNERTMVSKFHGYSQEKLHWKATDKKAMHDPAALRHIRNAFAKSPYRFDLYFWQSTEPDYDPFMQRGMVTIDWVRKMMGDTVADRLAPRPDAITVIMTNNLSDEQYISIRSPWILAHRIGHALLGGISTDSGSMVKDFFERFVERILEVGYGFTWNRWHPDIFQEEMSIMGKILGNKLGTMRSARNDSFVQFPEWWYETFAQYLLRGTVTLRPLPARVDDYQVLTHDPKRRRDVLKLWAAFPQRVERLFDRSLAQSMGHIFVI